MLQSPPCVTISRDSLGRYPRLRAFSGPNSAQRMPTQGAAGGSSRLFCRPNIWVTCVTYFKPHDDYSAHGSGKNSGDTARHISSSKPKQSSPGAFSSPKTAQAGAAPVWVAFLPIVDIMQDSEALLGSAVVSAGTRGLSHPLNEVFTNCIFGLKFLRQCPAKMTPPITHGENGLKYDHLIPLTS